jgi:putative transposase
MTNHVHLLAQGQKPAAIPGLMQSLGRRYVRYVNRTYGRTGTLFEGRYRASLVESERYLLTCMRYIELNPVRARIAARPADYRWSSFRNHAGQDTLSWIAQPDEYRRLGKSRRERAEAYRALFDTPMGNYELGVIREHLNKDCALGSSRFQAEIERMAGRRARVVPQGRPRKTEK